MTQENQTGYEKRDANARPVVQFGIALVVLIAVSMLISYWLDDGLTPEPPKENPYAPLPRPVAETTWPELQSNPFEEIDEHTQREARRLQRYEWIDRQNGIARIPIERAMSLYLAQQSAENQGEGGQ